MRMTAMRPSSTAGWRTVVRGGTEKRLSSVSSKPVTGHFARNFDAALGEGADRPDGHEVVGRDDCVDGGARVEEMRYLFPRVLLGEVAVDESPPPPAFAPEEFGQSRLRLDVPSRAREEEEAAAVVDPREVLRDRAHASGGVDEDARYAGELDAYGHDLVLAEAAEEFQLLLVGEIGADDIGHDDDPRLRLCLARSKAMLSRAS